MRKKKYTEADFEDFKTRHDIKPTPVPVKPKGPDNKVNVVYHEFRDTKNEAKELKQRVQFVHPYDEISIKKIKDVDGSRVYEVKDRRDDRINPFKSLKTLQKKSKKGKGLLKLKGSKKHNMGRAVLEKFFR